MDLEETLKEYQHQLRRFLSARIRNKSDVDDILQEILIKTFRHFKGLKDAKQFKPWLYRVARTTLIDYYRKNKNTGHVLEVDGGFSLEPEEQTGRELSGCLRPFIHQLPGKYRDALNAADIQQVSQKDLAARWGISYSAVKSRVQRGRQMLLGLFRQCCDFDVDRRGHIIDYRAKGRGCAGCHDK